MREAVCTRFGIALALLALAAAPPVLGQTPDGQTPANEGVCDVLLNATPGLYGLCVAFCEAQDCDFPTAVSGQCQAPDPRLLEIYDNLRGPNDPTMPCLRSPCPCFTEQEIREVNPPFEFCVVDSPAGLERVSAINNAAGEFAVTRDRLDATLADRCEIRYAEAGGGEICRAFSINQEEHDICQQILVDWIDQNGGCPTTP